MLILLNGPIGIGKSALCEALGEAIEGSVALDADRLAEANPLAADRTAQLHEVIALLVAHHYAQGYRHFVINHYWSDASAVADLAGRILSIDPEIEHRRCRLTLSEEENRRRIERRQAARVIDERDFEWRTLAEERAVLARAPLELGEPFDVSDPVDVLVTRMKGVLGL
jgi:hypothetical protein